MPVRAPRPCAYPGCSAVAVGSRYCNAHVWQEDVTEC